MLVFAFLRSAVVAITLAVVVGEMHQRHRPRDGQEKRERVADREATRGSLGAIGVERARG